jgi:hypothetical protein
MKDGNRVRENRVLILEKIYNLQICRVMGFSFFTHSHDEFSKICFKNWIVISKQYEEELKRLTFLVKEWEVKLKKRSANFFFLIEK